MKVFYFFIAYLFLLSSCKPDQHPDSPAIPEIKLNINNAVTAPIFSAELKQIKESDIKQVGFVWSTIPEPTINGSNVFSHLSQAGTLLFQHKVTAGLTKDVTYYVKAFCIDNSDTYHYSSQSSFISGGTKAPKLTGLPGFYTWGNEVELTLDTIPVTDIAYINILIDPGITVKPTKISGNKVYFNVPSDLQLRSNPLAVTIYGQKSNSIFLALNVPKIDSGGDLTLSYGSTLTIKGQYFHPDLLRNQVTIGTKKMEVVSATSTQLVVKVNDLSLSESGKLIIETGTNMIVQSTGDYFLYRFFTSKKDFPGVPRTEPVALILKGKLYFGLGRGKDSSLGLSDWWKYDPTDDTWTRVADCPVSAWIPHAFSADNKGYIGMGILNGNYSNSFYCYNPSTNTWTSIAPYPALFTTRCATFSTNRFGYLIAGDRNIGSGDNKVADVYKYVPGTNKWIKLSNFPGIPTSFASTFIINNKGYYIGGTGTGWGYLRKEAWSFDFLSETWKQISNIPEEAGTFGGFSFGLRNKGYIGGGITNASFSGDVSTYVYEYDPETDKWTQKDKILDDVRYYPGSVANGDIGYIITGNAYQASFHGGTKEFVQFSP